MKKKYAHRVKDITGMMQLNCDIRATRQESYLYANVKYDVTNLMEYLEKRKKKGEHITFFQAFVTALGKTFYNRPVLNRFVKNRHIYEHNGVSFAFVAKVSFNEKSEEMMVLVEIDPKDTVDTISKKMEEKINKIRNGKSKEVGSDKKGANNAIDVLAKLPNIIRVPVVGLFKFMDKKGVLPDFLAEDNIYYSSLILSNLGTFHFGAIHHNINEFGISSGLATIGEIKDEEVIIDGKKQVRKMVEFGANFDERASDGFYLIKSLQLLQKILDNPKLLEEPADAKVDFK